MYTSNQSNIQPASHQTTQINKFMEIISIFHSAIIYCKLWIKLHALVFYLQMILVWIASKCRFLRSLQAGVERFNNYNLIIIWFDCFSSCAPHKFPFSPSLLLTSSPTSNQQTVQLLCTKGLWGQEVKWKI